MEKGTNILSGKKIGIFNFCLVCLSAFQFMSDIILIKDNSAFVTIKALMEIVCYFLLLFVIFKKEYTNNNLIVIGIVTCLLTYGMYRSKMSAFVFAWLLIVASKGESYKRIIKKIYQSMLIVFLIAILCYIINLDFETFRYQLNEGLTLGFAQKNQAGLYFAYLFLMKKTWHKSPRKMYRDWLYGILVFCVTKSKTAMIVILLFPLIQIVYENALLKKKKYFLLLTKMLVPIFFVFNFICAKFFLISKLAQTLDKIMTNRIFLNWFILTKNKVTLWGQNIQLNYTGVHNPIRNTWNITTTVDNAYILSIIVMGIIPTILFALGYIKVIGVAWKERKVDVLVIAIIIALYGLSEVKTISIFFNFVYLYINTYHDTGFYNEKRGKINVT